MRELEFIKLYCTVCHHYDNMLVTQAQRTSNNFCPKFSDEECIATLIWGIANQKFDVKRCYEFIKDYCGGWFPTLPSYQTYNKRICFLADAFKALAGILLSSLGLDGAHCDFIYDSMPIVVAGGARSGRAKAAAELCSKGYCASKKMWYYGAKLHTIAQCNYKALPTPALMMISKACEHDRPIADQMLEGVKNMRVLADMALLNKEWQAQMLAENNVEILTPVKHKKREKSFRLQTSCFRVPFQVSSKLSNPLTIGSLRKLTFKEHRRCVLPRAYLCFYLQGGCLCLFLF